MLIELTEKETSDVMGVMAEDNRLSLKMSWGIGRAALDTDLYTNKAELKAVLNIIAKMRGVKTLH